MESFIIKISGCTLIFFIFEFCAHKYSRFTVLELNWLIASWYIVLNPSRELFICTKTSPLSVIRPFLNDHRFRTEKGLYWTTPLCNLIFQSSMTDTLTCFIWQSRGTRDSLFVEKACWGEDWRCIIYHRLWTTGIHMPTYFISYEIYSRASLIRTLWFPAKSSG
jgi:hypothetical protein